MMGIPNGDTERLTEMLRVFYVLHLDHGGGNLSTFTGKAVASGLADTYSSLAAAMAGLSGPRHGRANQDCLFVRRSEPLILTRSKLLFATASRQVGSCLALATLFFVQKTLVPRSSTRWASASVQTIRCSRPRSLCVSGL